MRYSQISISLAALALMLLAFMPTPSHALEQTASGTLNDQMSWNALSNSVTAINNRVTATNAIVNQMTICGNAGKVYAPGNGSKDANGCISAAVTLPPASPPPYGTVCGASSNSTEVGRPLIFTCQGHDPKHSCPAGFSGATVPVWGGKNGQSISYCFKN